MLVVGRVCSGEVMPMGVIPGVKTLDTRPGECLLFKGIVNNFEYIIFFRAITKETFFVKDLSR